MRTRIKHKMWCIALLLISFTVACSDPDKNALASSDSPREL